MALAPSRRYSQWIEHFSPEARQEIYTPDFKNRVERNMPDQLFDALFSRNHAAEWLDVILDADVNLYLADDLLVKMDRATMSHSLEGRSPFLDHVLMEFVASLPVSFKQDWGQKKRVLKAMLRGRVSDKLLDRPKMGFSVPLGKWFREDLREMARDQLLSKRSLERGYFQREQIGFLLDKHDAPHDYSKQLWDLLMLELWHRTFIDQGVPKLEVMDKIHSAHSIIT
jgi:asparagine synthase (glutamine-hydrolysing)